MLMLRVSYIFFLFLSLTCDASNKIFDEENPISDIERLLPKYLEASQHARGRDITVFIGNTGVGKSTLINLAAGFSLSVNSRSRIIVDSSEIEIEGKPVTASRIGSGMNSVTGYPEFIPSKEVGCLYDLPGFFATGGSVENILNACAINSVLTSARSVRVVFLTSVGEIEEAGRGFFSKKLNEFILMFEESFLKGDSCGVFINSVDREMLASESDLDSIKNSLSCLSNIKKINKFYFLKKARAGDGEEFISELKSTLTDGILSLKSQPVRKLNMSLTFDPQCSNSIEAFFKNSMISFLRESKESIFKSFFKDIKKKEFNLNSDFFEEQFLPLWNHFCFQFQKTKAYQLLSQNCEKQYVKALSEFEITFQYEHESEVHILRAQEQKNLVEKAQESEQEVRLETEKVLKELDEFKRRVSALKEEKLQIEKDAEQSQKLLKEAKEDQSKSLEEKKVAEKKTKECMDILEKKKKEFEKIMLENKKKQQEADEKILNLSMQSEETKRKLSDLQFAYEDRNKSFEEMKKMMEEEKENNVKKLNSLKKEHFLSKEKFKDEMHKIELDYERAMREATERHAREIAARQRPINIIFGGGGGSRCSIS